MNGRGTRRLLIVVAAVAVLAANAVAQDENTDKDAQAKLEAGEKQECINHLKLIYDAVQAYRMDHKDLPNWLSDLVPQYLPDANVLICPACKRTGKSEPPGMADPKIACSYLFEFSPQPLGKALPDSPKTTRREWKRRQMGLVGSVVPIVRCRNHKEVLNLAFDGTIYDSGASWENLLTNRINVVQLNPTHIFADLERGTNAADGPGSATRDPRFPPRDPTAKPGEIDLTRYYNAALTQSWHGNENNDLASLPSGLQTFGGVEFDVRGIVQLSSKTPAAKNYPPQIKGIKINRKCRTLHFLHAAGFGSQGSEGKQIGAYVIHYATNQMRLEIPIIYGRDVRNWHKPAGEKSSPGELAEVWTGENPISKASNGAIRLFETTWTNVAPNVRIDTIDYVSAMLTPAPFLIAITAEQ